MDASFQNTLEQSHVSAQTMLDGINAQRQYCLLADPERRRVYLWLTKDAQPEDALYAFYHASLLRHRLSDSSDDTSDLYITDEQFNAFTRQLKNEQWHYDDFLSDLPLASRVMIEKRW